MTGKMYNEQNLSESGRFLHEFVNNWENIYISLQRKVYIFTLVYICQNLRISLFVKKCFGTCKGWNAVRKYVA